MKTTTEIMRTACKTGTVIPAFNIPHLPMISAVIAAVRDEDSFALIEVARLEWCKFESKGYREVAEEFKRHEDPAHCHLHLDHIPVIDEDQNKVDFMADISGALLVGYQSVMVDGSRLNLDENIAATRTAAKAAHAAGVPIEAELGKVMGHETGVVVPYEELYTSGKGFTDVDEAVRFVGESGCDWLSVAVGNIHGAVSGALKDKEKPNARINIDHLRKLKEATGIPLVLHGGSGIGQEYVLEAIKNGIAKVNVGTEIRKVYEQGVTEGKSIKAGQEACYNVVRSMIRDYFKISGNAKKLNG